MNLECTDSLQLLDQVVHGAKDAEEQANDCEQGELGPFVAVQELAAVGANDDKGCHL